MPANPRDPNVWFDFAAKDLDRAHKRLAERDAEDCLFHLRQTAEKACKAKLIEIGWNLRKTHDLTELIQELEERSIDVNWYSQTASVLTSGYIADRYPGFSDDPIDLKALQEHLNLAPRLFETLTGRQQPSEPKHP
jgi:HEPN domain-containing protein